MHQINILLHVLAGSVALLVGLVALLLNNKYTWHVRLGRVFVRAIVVVILTGFAGVFLFQRNTFLLVLTMLSGYTCFAGVRTLKLRGASPRRLDIVVPFVAIGSALYYLYYIQSIGHYWAPVVTFSTVGALFLVAGYDLCRSFMSFAFRKRAMLYEHVYKMMSSLTACASAFAGTVLPQYKPYSQLLPSTLSLMCTFYVFIRIYNNRHPSQRNAILHNTSQHADYC